MSARPLPTERQIADLLDGLLALTRKVGKKEDKQFAVELLVARFKVAYERDRTGTSIPDGFPRGSSLDGVGGGGLRIRVEDDGETEDVAVTGVEWAMFERAEQRKSNRDHHRELFRQAAAELAGAVHALDRLRSLLARIDNLIDENPNAVSATKGCRSHARIKDGLGREYFEPLDREQGARDGLCRWCYGFVHDTEKNPEHELPPLRLLERLIVQGKVTTKDIEETRRSA